VVEREHLVRKMERGVVIDHIPAGTALSVLQMLRPDPSSPVVVALNVDNAPAGKEDLIMIEGNYLASTAVDYLSFVAPNATLTRIEGGQVKDERRVHLPPPLAAFVRCPNPSCTTNVEREPERAKFAVRKGVDAEVRLQCVSCGALLSSETGVNDLIRTGVSRGLVSREKIVATLLDLLLARGALKIASTSAELFTLKSGRASTYFINVGALTDGASLAEMRWLLASYIVFLLDEGAIEDFDFIFGPAYKGIPLATLACEGLSDLYGITKRYLYDRKEEKAYGDVSADRLIVGADHFHAGQKILLIDDVATTGETKVEALEKLKRLGPHTVVGLVLVVDRQERLGDAENGDRRSAVQFLHDEFNVKAFSILDAATIYGLVEDALPQDVRQRWIDYYAKYGSVTLL
jgi:aspartate carbamoyltransferase regulatory subunit